MKTFHDATAAISKTPSANTEKPKSSKSLVKILMASGVAVFMLSGPIMMSTSASNAHDASTLALRKSQIKIVSGNLTIALVDLMKDSAERTKRKALLQAVEDTQMRLEHLAGIEPSAHDLTEFLRSYKVSMQVLGDYSGPDRAAVTKLKAGFVEGALVVAAAAEADAAKATELENFRGLVELLGGSLSLVMRDATENEKHEAIIAEGYHLGYQSLVGTIEG